MIRKPRDPNHSFQTIAVGKTLHKIAIRWCSSFLGESCKIKMIDPQTVTTHIPTPLCVGNSGSDRAVRALKTAVGEMGKCVPNRSCDSGLRFGITAVRPLFCGPLSSAIAQDIVEPSWKKVKTAGIVASGTISNPAAAAAILKEVLDETQPACLA